MFFLLLVKEEFLTVAIVHSFSFVHTLIMYFKYAITSATNRSQAWGNQCPRVTPKRWESSGTPGISLQQDSPPRFRHHQQGDEVS